MGVIAELISTKIENFILNTVETRFDYPSKGEVYGPSGDDSPGLPDDRVYMGNIDGQGRSVTVGTLTISQGAEAGEKILFSRDSNGNTVAKIYFQKDGKLTIETDDEINIIGSKKVIIDGVEDIEIKSDAQLVLQNGSDFAVRNNELKTQIDSLKQTVAIHTHTFSYNAGPTPASGTTVTGLPAPTADFTNIKIDNINVPAVGE